jgi:Outer membrane protein beta-barrel domain
MTKSFGIILTIVAFANNFLFAQTNDAEIIKTKKSIFATNNQYKKPSRDYVMLQAGYNTWLLPAGSKINLENRGLEINGYICYDQPFAKSNFSFAVGAGIGSSSVYLDSQKVNFTDVNATTIHFSKDSIGFKRYKINTTYFEVPLEFRYFANKVNRNRGFKASIGVRVGTILGAKTKSVLNTANGNFKTKENNRRFFETWRITPTARMGWGNFSIYGAYQINELFKPTNLEGIGVRPLSIGICLSGL